MRRSTVAVLALASGLCAPFTLARADDTKPADPLAGPAVPAAAQQRTLIERDADGRIKRLDRAPAEAAVRLLNLGPDVQKQVDAILTERAAILDGLVAEHLREIVEIAGAAQSGDREGAMRKLMDLAPYARPLRERGQVGEELARALPEAQAGQVRQMVQAYTQALIQEERDAAKARGEAFNERAVTRTETLRLVGEEVRRSYERVVGQQAADFDKLIQTLNLSDEQESQVRKLVGDQFTQTYGKATAAQKARVFAEVWRLLSSEQRAELQRHMRQRGLAPAPDAPAPKPAEGEGKDGMK